MRRILVTGAATWTGSRLIQVLERHDDVLIVAVDEFQPRLSFASTFHEVHLDHHDFAALLLDFQPETVVHLQTVDRAAELGRARAHDEAVVGAQALFGAIGQAGSVRHVVVKSDAEIYGSGPRSPSIFTETTDPPARRGRYAGELRDMERMVAETATKHEEVAFSVVRLASIVGPDVANPISRFLALPAVPTVLGFDPRLQFVHQDDAVAVLAQLVDEPAPGTINVAGRGQLYLSRALRLSNRVQIPLPGRLYDAALDGLARMDISMPDHLRRLLRSYVDYDHRW